VTAIVAAIAVSLAVGPPAPVLHSHGDRLVAARGSSCWSEPTPDGGAITTCADTTPPVTKRSLRVQRHGRIRVEMGTPVTTLTASLRGRSGDLRVTRRSSRRFIVRLPRHMKARAVLDLGATYPQGDAAFGARLSR
jgi:hypothetical protein